MGNDNDIKGRVKKTRGWSGRVDKLKKNKLLRHFLGIFGLVIFILDNINLIYSQSNDKKKPKK